MHVPFTQTWGGASRALDSSTMLVTNGRDCTFVFHILLYYCSDVSMILVLTSLLVMFSHFHYSDTNHQQAYKVNSLVHMTPISKGLVHVMLTLSSNNRHAFGHGLLGSLGVVSIMQDIHFVQTNMSASVWLCTCVQVMENTPNSTIKYFIH